MQKKRVNVDVSRVNSNVFKHKIGQKKGQVTVFIILGILLLLALVLIIFLREEITSFVSNEILPTEKGKVENYILVCIQDLGEDALFQIGLQGGYIDVPKDISKDNRLSLQISPFNSIPYWAYGPTTNVPDLLQIKERIDGYIEDNLRDCVLGLEPFQDVYDIVEKSEITADTEIVDSKVIFNVHWNLDIKNKAGEVVTEVINHVVESPIKLKRVYELAKNILESEMTSLKVEDIAQDLIALEHPDVPLTGVELSCNKKEWDPLKVKSTLLNMLRINIRELKVKGTDLIEFPEVYYPEFEEGLPYYQNHYVWDIGEEVYPDTTVVFNYDENYPSTFAVTPISGNKMKSSQLGGNDLISFLCIQNWKFTYDLTFPVLVKVRDETTGYNFQMGFTAHLKQNKPDRSEVIARPSYLVETVTDADYCKVMNIPMTVNTYELIDNGAGVYYREPLENVNISYSCLRYRCEIGQTEYDYANKGNVAGFTANFPYCVGGILRGEKADYKDDWQRVVSKANENVELNLVPLFKFPALNVKVLKHELTEDNLVGPATELKPSEIVAIHYYYDKNDTTLLPTEQHYLNQNLVIGGDIENQIIEGNDLEFLAKANFPYRLEVNLFDGETFLGGYKGNWSVNWNDLENSNEIIFHVLTKKNPTEEEMFEMLVGMEELSTGIPVPEIN